MKRIVSCLVGIFALSFMNYAVAQDCDEIVLPHVGYNTSKLATMSTEKVQWYCNYSKNSFFLTNEIPVGATVYDISEVKSRRNGEKLASTFVVNLKKLSYYAYNFDEFQYKNYHKVIYFHTPNSTYKYLGLYTITETFKRTDAQFEDKK